MKRRGCIVIYLFISGVFYCADLVSLSSPSGITVSGSSAESTNPSFAKLLPHLDDVAFPKSWLDSTAWPLNVQRTTWFSNLTNIALSCNKGCYLRNVFASI